MSCRFFADTFWKHLKTRHVPSSNGDALICKQNFAHLQMTMSHFLQTLRPTHSQATRSSEAGPALQPLGTAVRRNLQERKRLREEEAAARAANRALPRSERRTLRSHSRNASPTPSPRGSPPRQRAGAPEPRQTPAQARQPPLRQAGISRTRSGSQAPQHAAATRRQVPQADACKCQCLRAKNETVLVAAGDAHCSGGVPEGSRHGGGVAVVSDARWHHGRVLARGFDGAHGSRAPSTQRTRPLRPGGHAAAVRRRVRRTTGGERGRCWRRGPQ